MIQNEEKNLNPEIQAHSANPDPEIQNSEVEFDEENATTIQNVIKFTDQTTIQNLAPEIQATVQRPEITISKIPNIQEEALSTKFQANIDSKFQFNATYLDVPDLAFNGRRPTPANRGTEDGAVAKGMAEPFSHFMEDDDAADLASVAIRSVDDASLEKAEARANRPPPEPPDSNLLEVGKKEPASAEEMSRQPVKVTNSVTGIHHDAEVGTFAERMWTTTGRRTAAAEADGSLRVWQLRRFFLLTPPPLVAAMFPWDRGGRNNGFEEDLFSSLLMRPATMSYNGAFIEARCPWSRGGEAVVPGFGAAGIGSKEVVERGTGQGEVVNHGFLYAQRGLLQNDGEGELTPVLGLGFDGRGLVQVQNKYKLNQNSLV
ncbi:hypothetical protein PIB30_009258 [Stylosanthes scabra]|uniref:Uncharacterized protein n=1 Tax=Stylosanthes scabra TaxID=79078 RepID=A0ABU6R5L1_9FABA|nr:hypothetical protein [Stylosanthes scabra]